MADNDKNMTDMSSDEIIDLDSIIAEDKNLDIEPTPEKVTTESVEEEEPSQEVKETAEVEEESLKEDKVDTVETERLPIESIYDSITTVEEKKAKRKKEKKEKKEKQVEEMQQYHMER